MLLTPSTTTGWFFEYDNFKKMLPKFNYFLGASINNLKVVAGLEFDSLFGKLEINN